MNAILRLLSLRRNEMPRLLNAALVFFLVAVNDGIVKSVAAGVFNIRVGVEYLPNMYAWIALFFAVNMAGLSWLSAKVARQQLLFGLMGVVALLLLVNTAALWLEHSRGVEPFVGFFPFLFVSSELGRFLCAFQVWIVAGGICYTSRAKVLFPLLVASAYLGEVTGGFATGFLGSLLVSYQLYGLTVLNMIVVIAALRPLVRRYFVSQAADEGEGASLPENLRFFFRSSYLRLLFVLSVAVFAVYTAIHYAFNVVARERYPTEGEITGFLGMFYGTAGFATLLVTALGLRVILRWFGTGSVYLWVSVSYAALALVLLALFGDLLSVEVVAVMFVLNLVSFLLLDSVVAPAYQVLIKLIPARNSDGTRMIMEGGFMLLGGLLGAGFTMLHARELLSLEQLFGLLTAVGALMVIVSWRFKRAYAQVLIRAVREQDIDVEDDQAMESLVKVVSSSLEFPRSLLMHVDDGVRQMGIEILRQCPGPVVAQVCTPMVDHDNPRIRSAALDALGGDAVSAEAVVALLPRLEDAAAEVRYSAARAVRRFAEHQSATGRLAGLPDQTYSQVVDAVLPHLEDNGQPTGGSGSAPLEAQFITILGIMGHEASASRRRSQTSGLLSSSATEDVIAGIVAVGQLETGDFQAELLQHLAHPHPGVREAAVENLGGISSRETFEAMVQLLDDPDPDVVHAVVVQLGTVTDPELLQSMEAGLGAGPLREWEGFLAALIRLGDDERHERLVEACRNRLLDANRNLVAVELLARSGSAAVELLTDQLELENKTIQDGVIGLLGHLGDMDVVVDLLDRLSEGNEEARENAIELLENMADRELMGLLLPLLEADPEERQVAARAVTGDALPVVDAVIGSLLQTPNSWTRMAAAWAARALDKGEMLAVLGDDPAAHVRETVAELVSEGGGMEVEQQAQDAHLPLTTMDKITFLKQSPFFAELPLEELYHIAQSMEEEAVVAGSRVINEGTTGDKMYIVVRGRLEVRKFAGEDNTEGQFIAALDERQVFGEMALLDDEPRSASVLAVGDAHLLSLQRSNLERLLRRYASIAFNMMRILSQRLRDSMAA